MNYRGGHRVGMGMGMGVGVADGLVVLDRIMGLMVVFGV